MSRPGHSNFLGQVCGQCYTSRRTQKLKTLAGCMPQIPLNQTSDKSSEQCLGVFAIRVSERNPLVLCAHRFAELVEVILQPSSKTK